jgi:hypothetical protein
VSVGENAHQVQAPAGRDNEYTVIGEFEPPHKALSRQLSELPKYEFEKRCLRFGDCRFIPNREGQDLQASYSLLHDDGSPATPSRQKKRIPHTELHFQKSKCLSKQTQSTHFMNFH